MNRADLSLEMKDADKAKRAIELSLRGNERVNISVKANEMLEIALEAEDKTSFRGSLNSALRLSKLAEKMLN